MNVNTRTKEGRQHDRGIHKPKYEIHDFADEVIVDYVEDQLTMLGYWQGELTMYGVEVENLKVGTYTWHACPRKIRRKLLENGIKLMPVNVATTGKRIELLAVVQAVPEAFSANSGTTDSIRRRAFGSDPDEHSEEL